MGIGEELGPWHEFFSLIGSGSATLVGLMFVAASVGSGVFTQERQTGLRTFLSPTVVAFSAVLVASLIGILPARDWIVPGLLEGSLGVFGLSYSIVISRRMLREGYVSTIDLEDRLWYVLAPAAAYGVILAAGILLLLQRPAACAVLAAGMVLLLLAGLRNAWDMTTWAVLRRRD